MTASANSLVWTTRGLIGFVAIVLAYWAFDYSAAINIRRANPELAYRLRPTDPGAVSAAMNDRLAVRNQFRVTGDDAANVRIALQKEPLNRVLLRTVGIRAEVGGDQKAAFKAMQMADRVSRRDSITQLWLAEYARRKDDYVGEVRHFDAAMQVKADLQQLVFPQMIKGLASPEFRDVVRPYVLTRRGTWSESFVGTTVLTDVDAALALVRPILGKMADGGFDLAFSRLTASLAARGEPEQAMALARQVFTGFDPGQFSDIAITEASLDRRLGSLAWSFNQTGEISSSVDEANRIVVVVLPLASGEVAQRDLFVRPGTSYRLSQKIDYASAAAKARIRWTAGCVSAKRITGVWQGDAPQLDGVSTFDDPITIPADCHLLRLTANVVGAENQVPSELSISQLQLVPGRRTASPATTPTP